MKFLTTSNLDIDIIILDLMMPKMNGEQFLKTLDSNPTLKKPDVCILSSKIDKNVIRGLKNISVIDYFIKGDHLDDLIHKIEFSSIVNDPIQTVASVYTPETLMTRYQIIRQTDESLLIKSEVELPTNSIIQITLDNEEKLYKVLNVSPHGIRSLVTCQRINSTKGKVA